MINPSTTIEPVKLLPHEPFSTKLVYIFPHLHKFQVTSFMLIGFIIQQRISHYNKINHATLVSF